MNGLDTSRANPPLFEGAQLIANAEKIIELLEQAPALHQFEEAEKLYQIFKAASDYALTRELVTQVPKEHRSQFWEALSDGRLPKITITH